MDYRKMTKGCLASSALFLIFISMLLIILLSGCSSARHQARELPERDEAIYKAYLVRKSIHTVD